MMTAQAGTRIRVTHPNEEFWGSLGLAGMTGVIESVDFRDPWPYFVRLDEPLPCGAGKEACHLHDAVVLEREEFEIIRGD